MIRSCRPDRCPLCDRPGLEVSFVIADHRYYRCRSCDLIQMSPLPDVGVADDYTGFDLDRYRRFADAFLVPQYRRALKLIGETRRSGRLLDIGCGTGEFLDQAKAAGFEVTGIEPSATAGRVAGERHNVIHGKFEEAPLPARAYDVVTFWSVLEHVPRPLAFLEKVRAVARPDAVVAFRVPAADGVLPAAAHFLYRISLGAIDRPLRIIYQLDWHYKHYYGYNARNAARLLRRAGYEPILIRRESSYDVSSLEERMDYLPRAPLPRVGFKAALSLILGMSQVLDRHDEMVVIARAGAPRGRP